MKRKIKVKIMLPIIIPKIIHVDIFNSFSEVGFARKF